MTNTVSIQDATKNLPDIIEKLRGDNYFVVQKNGKPVAGIVGVDDMEDFLDLQNAALKKQIKKGYAEFKAGKAKPARLVLETLLKQKS